MTPDRGMTGPTAAGRKVGPTHRLLRGADPLFRYGALLVLAEFIAAFASMPLGLLMHVVALLACALGYLQRPAEPSSRVLAVLAFVPLVRLLGLTMPLEDLPPWSWYVLAGAPLLAGTVVMASRLGMSARDLALTRRTRPRADATVIAIGLLLGFVAVPLGAGPNLVDGGLLAGLATALSLLLFVAVPEELVFRGLLHRLAADAHGRAGIGMVAVLYAATFVASFSAAAVLIMGVAGVAFAWSLERGGSLVGTIAAHAILVIGAALVWPAVFT